MMALKNNLILRAWELICVRRANGRILAGWVAGFRREAGSKRIEPSAGTALGRSARQMMLGVGKSPASHAASATAAARRRVQARLMLWANACHRKMVFTLAVPRTVS